MAKAAAAQQMARAPSSRAARVAQRDRRRCAATAGRVWAWAAAWAAVWAAVPWSVVEAGADQPTASIAAGGAASVAATRAAAPIEDARDGACLCASVLRWPAGSAVRIAL